MTKLFIRSIIQTAVTFINERFRRIYIPVERAVGLSFDFMQNPMPPTFGLMSKKVVPGERIVL